MTIFRGDEKDLEDGDVANLLPTVSFPHDRAASKYVAVKMVLFNIECLFYNVDIFDNMMKKNFNLDLLSKQDIIDNYLGGDEYYSEIKESLKLWYNKECVMFIAHSLLKEEKLNKLLQKLDFLKFFIGNNMEDVLSRRTKTMRDGNINELKQGKFHQIYVFYH